MITIIAGTNRPGSNTLKLAKQLEPMYQAAGNETCILDLMQLPAEVFQPGVYAEKPEQFTREFVEPVLQADGLVVVCPEYNGSFAGILKYFVDLLPFPESFECRPVAFVGIAAGQFGGLRPVEQMQQVFGYRNAYVFNRRVFITGAYKVFDAEGAITDPDLVLRLQDQAVKFTGFVRSLKAQ
jgi:chromate reductase, NAD(P)H dehydrogenase (quinone)